MTTVRFVQQISDPYNDIEEATDALAGCTALPGHVFSYILKDELRTVTVTEIQGGGPLLAGQTEVVVPVQLPRRFRLWTIQMANWKKAKDNRIRLVDSTVKSGLSFLAPTWDMVLGHKREQITDEQYTREYLERMDTSMAEWPERWKWLIDHREVAIACYCKPGTFCHRHLLVGILEKFCQRHGVAFEHMGELS